MTRRILLGAVVALPWAVAGVWNLYDRLRSPDRIIRLWNP